MTDAHSGNVSPFRVHDVIKLWLLGYTCNAQIRLACETTNPRPVASLAASGWFMQTLSQLLLLLLFKFLVIKRLCWIRRIDLEAIKAAAFAAPITIPAHRQELQLQSSATATSSLLQRQHLQQYRPCALQRCC